MSSTKSKPKPVQGKASPGSSRAWDALTPPLSEWILDAVSSMGFHRMTPVQASTMPLFMGHKDVVVEAVTGSGKTLAFLIPIVERLLRLEEPIKKHHVGAIIVSPTRELASQINAVLLSLLAFHAPSAAALRKQEGDVEMTEDGTDAPVETTSPASTLQVIPQLLLGGTTTPAQDLSHFLKHSPNLLISTPGRLLELLSSPHVHCPQSSFEVLVLDEADRLLDMGFKEDLQKILARLPKQRRTGLFSASVSEAVDQIVRVGLRNPVKVAVKVKGAAGIEDKRTPASLQMTYILAPPTHKLPALRSLLTSLTPTPLKTIIYLSTCAAVDYYQHLIPALFPNTNFTLIPLHGKHPPQVRQKNFSRFVNSPTPSLLLTTDLAARGLDIPQVDLVIQLDPPTDPKAFLHRCGRAGRAGRKGLAVLFLTPGREEDYISFLAVRKTPVTALSTPTIAISASDAEATTRQLRAVVRADRALHDKAQRAFVSWVQAYRKHQASSIFRVDDLDWTELAHAWALLRLPKMPELKKWGGDRSLGLTAAATTTTTTSTDPTEAQNDGGAGGDGAFDFDSYAYKDRAREAARLKDLEAYRRSRTLNPDTTTTNDKKRKRPPKRSEAWSEKTAQKTERDERREKKHARREASRVAKLTPAEKEDEDKLKRLLEKVRKRTISKEAEEEEEWAGFD